MAIKSGLSLGVVSVGTSDTTMFEQDSISNIQRYAVEAASIHNTTTSTISDIAIYESSDLTSASGERLALYSLGGGQSKDVFELIGHGFEDKNLIILAGATGVNSLVTVTTYNDDD